MNKLLACVLAALAVAITVIVMVGINNHKVDTTQQADAQTDIDIEVSAEASNEAEEDVPAVIASDEEVQAAETATEASEQPATMTTGDIDEVAYKDDVTAADTKALIEWLEGQPDIDAGMVADFISEYPEVWVGYQKDQDGNYLTPLNMESLRQQDQARVFAAKNLGLSQTQIDDALAKPFTLNAEQVKKIVNAKQGKKLDFNAEEIKNFRTELFRSWLENPILFEAYVRLICDQKIGDGTKVIDHYATGRKFLEAYDNARTNGTGLNLWLRQNANTGVHYTTPEYQQYVVAFIGLFEDKETIGMALTAQKLDHYNLLWSEADLNSLRKATPADYEDPYAALWFNIYLKNGKVGIRIGANFRDKRPEIFNYQTTTKPAKKTDKKTTTTTAKPTTQAAPATPSTPSTPSNPNPHPTPQPTPPGPKPTPPKPEPEPEPTPDPEYKYPTDDPVAQGNADIGGGVNDDPGPGEWKPDQGDSQSETVPDSQYQPGNSENTDPTPYDPGPVADNTDGGTPPPTTPITDQGQNNDDYGGGDAGDNNGGMPAPPPVD